MGLLDYSQAECYRNINASKRVYLVLTHVHNKAVGCKCVKIVLRSDVIFIKFIKDHSKVVNSKYYWMTLLKFIFQTNLVLQIITGRLYNFWWNYDFFRFLNLVKITFFRNAANELKFHMHKFRKYFEWLFVIATLSRSLFWVWLVLTAYVYFEVLWCWAITTWTCSVSDQLSYLKDSVVQSNRKSQ